VTDQEIIDRAMRILHDRATVGIDLRDPHDLVRHAALRLEDETREILLGYWLDRNDRLIGIDEIAAGAEASINFSLFDLARKAVAAKATGAFLVHNHPNQNADPSEKDKATAQRVNVYLAQLAVLTLGHFAVTRTAATNILTGDRATFVRKSVDADAPRCPKCNYILETP
jgi:DNA repair protein RadC